MERKIIKTADGSTTIHIAEWDEQYHSKHGAIQEAYHVFINHGLSYFIKNELFQNSNKKSVSILEIGFGTGLNALITLKETQKRDISIDYYGVEGYPVTKYEVDKLNYSSLLNVSPKWLEMLHECSWEEKHTITKAFKLIKQKKSFDSISDQNLCNIIYFDAFGARVQPELWTEIIFKKMYAALKPNGILVTYSAKGSVRRALIASGFQVEKLPGPPGKREMLRATKVMV